MRKHNEIKWHDSRGMTLVELLVVMVIMSVVMMAVMSLYIPVHQSTVAQTQVSDVQSNLRLALKTITRDLMVAGFLVPYDPIIFPTATPSNGFHLMDLDDPGFDATNLETTDPHNFIIRTRLVGSDFARVVSASDDVGGFELTLSDSDMAENFPSGSKVRLFEPVAGTEVVSTRGSDLTRVYTVLSSDPSGKIDISYGELLFGESDLIAEETIVVRMKNANTEPLQTIQYSLEDGALKRIVNGVTQILARNVDTDTPATRAQYPSVFNYTVTDGGRINWISIKLTGKTKALKDDAISGEKVRAVETSVKLRNIN